MREIVDLLDAVRPRGEIGGRARPRRAGGDRHDVRGERDPEGAAPRRMRRACRRSPTIPASRSMRSAASRASIRRAGPARRAISPLAMRKVEERLQAAGATTPEQRRAHFVCVLALALPDGEVETFPGRVDGTLVWPPRGDQGFGYDPIFLPDGHSRTFRRDERGGEARLAARRREALCRIAPAPSSFSRARCLGATMNGRGSQSPRAPPPSASMSTGRSARRSAPIATSTPMSATRRRTRRASRRPLRASWRISRR